MSTNFNNAVPAAPPGYTNVTWATDGFGNDSACVPTAILTDLNTLITSLAPGDVLVWNGSEWVNAAPPSSLDLEVNGVQNVVQSLLNLIAGSNITLTDNGSGGVTIASTGGSSAPTVNPQTASYVAVIGDENNIITMDVVSPNSFTVPPNSSVAYPVGTSLTVIQLGAGQTTVAPGAGVTINTPTSLTLRVQFSTVALIQTAIDVWEASGDFTLAGSSADFVKLDEVILGAPAASISFNSISQSYRHLRILLVGRNDSSTNPNAYIQFNGDSGSNYNASGFFAGTTTGQGASATATPVLFTINANNANANFAGISEAVIYDYSATRWNKSAHSTGHRASSTSTGFIDVDGVTWDNTAAITDILISIGGGDNFATGTVATLYGLK